MSDLNSESDYAQDSRIPCKYGDKCYQKNPTHHSKYKHPLKKLKRKDNSIIKPQKRIKLDSESVKSPNDVQDDGLKTEQDEILKQQEPNAGAKEKAERKRECISSSDSEDSSESIGTSNEEIKVKNTKDGDERIPKDILHESTNLEEKRKLEVNEMEKLMEEQEESFKAGDETVQEQSSESEIIKAETSMSEQKELFNPKTFIKTRFLVNMPNDFYEFWKFCKELKPMSPSDALSEVGLKLVGPYDVLADKFKHVKKSSEEYLCHWRYYYDTPEVLTVIKGDDRTGYHIGYFYDSPNEAPSFLISNHGTKNGIFTKMGDNIFAAVSLYLEELKKVGDPFKKMHVGKFLSKIKSQAKKLKLDLSSHSKQIKERDFKVVASTFNKVGIVVPYDKKTQLGYRELALKDKELMTLLTKLEKAAPEQKPKYLSDLQPVLTYANIALDECDFGTGLKLGWELLYHGIDSLNSTIAQFLANSYRLLNKEAFAKIAEAHMKQRKRGYSLSII